MTDSIQIHEALGAFAAGDGVRFDLGEAALLLAALDRPGVGLDRYRRLLDHLAARTGEQLQSNDDPGAVQVIAAVNDVLFREENYRGDERTYDDLQNANLMRVMDRKCGLPVSLGILYIHAARGAGYQAAGLNFPGHFLVRVEKDGERLIVDPFNGGKLLRTPDLRNLLKALSGPGAELHPDHYRTVDDRQILLRLQNNVKLRLLQNGHIEEALKVVQSMLAFAPDEQTLWREAGLMQARVGDIPSAIASLECYLLRVDTDDARYRASVLLHELRARLH
ncbi:tetratricopeptide repeat protein [Alphaproteobacteria bacterium HT1-32]|nr:tetratricopeptide repeat protein [Alphaproteobacteria bacterium HT1-32]